MTSHLAFYFTSDLSVFLAPYMRDTLFRFSATMNDDNDDTLCEKQLHYREGSTTYEQDAE